MRPDYILTLSCPDRTGIVYRVTGLLYELGCNILDAQQFGDEESRRFFLRVHFDLPSLAEVETLQEGFASLADNFGMDWKIHDARRRARLLVLVSKQGHCLNDLLFRAHSRQLPVDIAAVASNHDDFAALAGFLRRAVPPPAGERRRTSTAQEQRILELVERERIDLVVLARYMQILSPELCDALAGPRDQHPPQLPAQLQGRQALPPGAPARGQDHRRHRALRDRAIWTRARSSNRTWPAWTTR